MPLVKKSSNCRGKGPKRKHTNFTPPPLLARGGMSTPSGCRSPNLMLLGLEPSRGFSRSASCPHGQVFGGAVTKWSFSRPVDVAEAALAQAQGQRFMRLGASRYPPFCVSWSMSWPRPGPSAQLLSSCSYRSQYRPHHSRLSARNFTFSGKSVFLSDVLP